MKLTVNETVIKVVNIDLPAYRQYAWSKIKILSASEYIEVRDDGIEHGTHAPENVKLYIEKGREIHELNFIDAFHKTRDAINTYLSLK